VENIRKRANKNPEKRGFLNHFLNLGSKKEMAFPMPTTGCGSHLGSPRKKSMTKAAKRIDQEISSMDCYPMPGQAIFNALGQNHVYIPCLKGKPDKPIRKAMEVTTIPDENLIPAN